MDEMKVPLDAVVIPVGGGGLLAGMALAIKTCQPNVKVIVSQCELSWGASCLRSVFSC